MSNEPESTGTNNGESPKPDYGFWQRTGLMVGVAGLAVFAGLGAAFAPAKQFYLSYLVGYIFVLSFPVGSTALLLIQYLTTGQWGLLMQRSFEACTRTLPLMVVLFIPLGVGVTNGELELSPYWWTETDEEGHLVINEYIHHEAAIHELQGKVDDFLNGSMFWTVGLATFAVWGMLIIFLNGKTRTPENGDDETNKQAWEKGRDWLSRLAGPGLVLCALSATAVATMLVMSLEMTWHSTMFPVIYWINQLLTAYAFSLVVVLFLGRKGYPLEKKVFPLHQIDMGSFLLAFTLFWTYINFSQYMLVWVGNLPEEIPYFLKRTRGGWGFVAIALVLFHFAMPFLLLLFRHVKNSPRGLAGVAIGLMAMCAFDVIWWIEPSHGHGEFPLFWLMDVGAIAGFGGIFLCYYVNNLKQRDLLPKYQEHKLRGGHHDHE